MGEIWLVEKSQSTLGSGFSFPSGVAVDGSGNVFVADLGNNRVMKLDFANAPTLTFATPTPVGSTDTTDGPQTVTVQNIGNAPLIFPVPSVGSNPSISQYVSRHSHEVVDYRVFRGEYSDLRTPQGVLESVKGFSGRGIVQFGLMLLVGFQVVRVMVTGLLFLSNRDWVFVGITAAVLVLLAYGLLYESGLWVFSASGH